MVCEAVPEVLLQAATAPAEVVHSMAKAGGGGGDVLAILNVIMPIMLALEAKSQARRTGDSEHPRDATMMYTTPKK